MDATTRIRNLSIALEALYRIGNCDHEATDVYQLLVKEISKQKEKKGLYNYIKPTKPSTDFIPEPFKP